MPRKPLPERSVLFKGIEEGVLILLDTSYDFESLIKIVNQRIKANKKFFQNTKIFINGADNDLDFDQIGMARKMIFDKTKVRVIPVTETNLRLNEQKNIQPEVVKRTFRAGSENNFKNDVVIFGDVNPGAKIVSGGNIIVYGKIRGEVCAGEPNNLNSVIVANGINPITLSIGGINLEIDSIDEQSKSYSSYAKVEEGKVKVILMQENKDE
jgi:septum site-determining protein MinC